MINWLSTHGVTVLAGIILTLQGFLSYQLSSDSYEKYTKINEYLAESNIKLDSLISLVRETSKNSNMILSDDPPEKILQWEPEIPYCQIKENNIAVMKVWGPGHLKIWSSTKKPLKISLSNSPNMMGSLFTYGNSLMATVTVVESKTNSLYRFEDIFFDESGALRSFRIDGSWFNRENCKKLDL